MGMDIQNVIDQNGKLTCSICKHAFEWKYKFDLMNGTDWEANFGRMPTGIDDKPSRHVSFIIVEDDKVQFLITCPKCLSVHQTKPMNMKSR